MINAVKHMFIIFFFIFLLYHSLSNYVIYLYFLFIIYVLVDDIINYPIAIFLFSYPIIIYEQIFVLKMLGYVPTSAFHTITRKLILVYIIMGISIIIGLTSPATNILLIILPTDCNTSFLGDANITVLRCLISNPS